MNPRIQKQQVNLRRLISFDGHYPGVMQYYRAENLAVIRSGTKGLRIHYNDMVAGGADIAWPVGEYRLLVAPDLQSPWEVHSTWTLAESFKGPWSAPVDPDKLPWDYKKLLEDMRPGAEKAVRRTLLLEAIAEKEGLMPSEADVDAEIERIAQAGQRPAPAVRRMMEQSGDLDSLRFSMRERRVIDFLIERARVTA